MITVKRVYTNPLYLLHVYIGKNNYIEYYHEDLTELVRFLMIIKEEYTYISDDDYADAVIMIRHLQSEERDRNENKNIQRH